MINVSIPDMTQLQSRLNALPAKVDLSLGARMSELAQDLVQRIRNDKLSGQVLGSVTGRLKESIAASVTADGDTSFTASVGVEGDVPYAAIQESGGSTKAHIIQAVNAKALSFVAGGKQAFFASVNHPGSQIPAHDYLSSALDDAQDNILDGMSDALTEAIEG